MIVVVIIGILAAVAIPSYQGFQKKAKGSEAKVQLSAIYSAEQAFKAEHNNYTGDLEVVGLVAAVLKYYSVGFGAGFAGTTGGGTAGNFIITKAGAFSATASTLLTSGPATASVATGCLSGHVATDDIFTACAGGTATEVDAWTITSAKVLSQL